MPSFIRPAWLAFAFVATAMPASAQTWIYEADVPRAPTYEPRYYYEPRPRISGSDARRETKPGFGGYVRILTARCLRAIARRQGSLTQAVAASRTVAGGTRGGT